MQPIRPAHWMAANNKRRGEWKGRFSEVTLGSDRKGPTMTDDTFYGQAAGRLKRQRWTLLSGLADQLSAETADDQRRLIEEARSAPVDRYCPEGFRQRYFHKGFVLDDHFLPDRPRLDDVLGKVIPF